MSELRSLPSGRQPELFRFATGERSGFYAAIPHAFGEARRARLAREREARRADDPDCALRAGIASRWSNSDVVLPWDVAFGPGGPEG